MANAWKPEYTQEKFYTLFDGLDEPVYVSDPDTHEILFANKKIREKCGNKILGPKPKPKPKPFECLTLGS
jgi:hypothetical protein